MEHCLSHYFSSSEPHVTSPIPLTILSLSHPRDPRSTLVTPTGRGSGPRPHRGVLSGTSSTLLQTFGKFTTANVNRWLGCVGTVRGAARHGRGGRGEWGGGMLADEKRVEQRKVDTMGLGEEV